MVGRRKIFDKNLKLWEKRYKIMEHKWNFEITINGELDYWNKFTVDEIMKIKNFIKNNIEKEEE